MDEISSLSLTGRALPYLCILDLFCEGDEGESCRDEILMLEGEVAIMLLVGNVLSEESEL